MKVTHHGEMPRLQALTLIAATPEEEAQLWQIFQNLKGIPSIPAHLQEVLDIIREYEKSQGGCSSDDIVSELGLSSSNASNRFNKLMNMGLATQ